MKKSQKNRIKIAASVTLAAALLVTGSLAWQDVNQHKTNKFATKSVAHSMVLIEDFQEVEGWTLGQGVRKEISVRNGQESDDTTRLAYNDGYVRLQIREFLGIADQEYVTSENRLMIDTKGDFYRFKTEQEAKDTVIQLGLNGGESRTVKLKGINDDQAYYYIKTQAGDPNGQYGKFLLLDINQGELKSIVDGSIVTDIDKDAEDKHNFIDNVKPNTEDSNIYTTHVWKEGEASFTDRDNKFSEYVEWSLGEDVISLNDWKENYDSKQVAKWIVDTSDGTNGYVYWGQKLTHATTSSENSVTSKLLETVKLIKQPKGHAEYRIHVNMDAVSYDDLGLWTDGNSDIINAYKSTDELTELLKVLQETISLGEKADKTGKPQEAIKYLEDVVTEAKKVYENGGPTTEIVTSSIQNIKDAIKALKVSFEPTLEGLLPVAKAEENYVEKYFVNIEKWDLLNQKIENAETVLEKENPTQIEKQEAYDELLSAYESFKDGKGLAKDLGERLYVADRKFTFVKHDTNLGNAMIISDPLSKQDYEMMNTKIDVSSNGMRFDADTDTYRSYEQSNVYIADREFYSTFIAPSTHIENVRPVIIEQEEFDSVKWSNRTDHPTIVGENGERTAFSLSVSDMFSTDTGDKIVPEHLFTTSAYWLRSPWISESRGMTGQKNIATLFPMYIHINHTVRPALWVALPKF